MKHHIIGAGGDLLAFAPTRPMLPGRDTCNGSCEQACGCLCIEQAATLPVQRSRVFRDERPAPLPLGVHRALQWLGVVLLAALLGLSALFHRGSLKVEALAAYFGGQA